MQGIIYTRVSSDEQVSGTSLDSQEQVCRAYCKERSITVLAVFREEGASAKTAVRAELLRSLEYCRRSRGQVQAFVVAKVDRFARNTEDHFSVRKLLLAYGVALHSVTEPIGNRPTEKFVETVLAASSEFDNAIRKQRCTDGMMARLKQGIWPWKPPPGYRSLQTKRRGEKKTQPDPPDPETFPLIQRALKEYLKGVIHSQAELARLLDRLGLAGVRGMATRPQFVDRILGRYLNFYAGILVNPWTGEERLGLHTPMITPEELGQIRLIRSGKAHVVPRNRLNPQFPLRRTALCDSCHRALTGSVSRGNGGTYPYYHCVNQGCAIYGKSHPKDAVESAFARLLDRVTPRPKYLGVLQATVLDVAADMKHRRISDADRSRHRIAELEAKRKRVFEMREDGSYTRETFRERLAALDGELAEARASTTYHVQQELDPDALQYATAFLGRLRNEWLAIDPSVRPRFQKLVLPDGIPYDRERGFGTAQLSVLLELSQSSGAPRSRLVHLVRVSWNQILDSLTEIMVFRNHASSRALGQDTRLSEDGKEASVAA